MRYPLLAAILCLPLAACATKLVSTVSSPAAPSPATRAELIALALQDAAAADAAGDAEGLGRALRVVDAAGARPIEPAGEDPVPAWRTRAADAEPPLRGRPLGPGYRSGRIAAGGRDSFAQLFLSGTASTIAISAPSGDRVALSVLDKDAKPVCKREGTRGGACRWVPLFTQRYTIEVQNLGASDARYFLVIE
ncbi:MAG: hypothetical protein RIQ46_2072 [Pseudomonadota bacterium]|jgi:hypothetical protein